MRFNVMFIGYMRIDGLIHTITGLKLDLCDSQEVQKEMQGSRGRKRDIYDSSRCHCKCFPVAQMVNPGASNVRVKGLFSRKQTRKYLNVLNVHL